MNKMPKLPVGIESFEEIRTEGFYYIDKTRLIRELLDGWGKVNLFTRPRRFGKSLNMSMLQYFFEYGCDGRLFEGLEISREERCCREHMGKFPVVSVTLKGVSARDFATAQGMLRSVLGREAMRFRFLLESDKLSDGEKEQYRQLVRMDASGRQGFSMPDEVLADSLLVLSGLLHRHYGRKVILLIDEYDVPLDKAQQAGYYEEMTGLVRNLFGQALKSNPSLHFAVLTGCLRVARESIFTGLNNLNTFSVTDAGFSSHFGFTDEEVRTLLRDYQLEEHYGSVREWYDGYRFGSREMYCPWDVINYVKLLLADPGAEPRAFWINTSGNDVVRRFVHMAPPRTRQELEKLVNGECIAKRVDQELTYRDLYGNIDNLWSVLFTTGYLTQRGSLGDDVYSLAIPNLEIRKIFTRQILEWFQNEVQKDAPSLDAFCAAFPAGDAGTAERLLGAYLRKTISIRDTGERRGRKESFYHGLLLGLLGHREDWYVASNAESGEGYSDILVEIPEQGVGIAVEIKYPEDGDLEKGCREALEQIGKRGYGERLRQDGMDTVIGYGIAFYKKRCRVRLVTD